MRPVSIVTVSNSGFFFIRLLVERVRALIGPRPYEIIVVDRGRDKTSRTWCKFSSEICTNTDPLSCSKSRASTSRSRR
jgi:hypothetical protein